MTHFIEKTTNTITRQIHKPTEGNNKFSQWQNVAQLIAISYQKN